MMPKTGFFRPTGIPTPHNALFVQLIKALEETAS